MKKLLSLLMATVFASGLNAQSNNAFVGADLIVYNAKITTQTAAQRDASAVAVKGGRIYAVGGDAEILGLKDKRPG
jgi:hypothetical protein